MVSNSSAYLSAVDLSFLSVSGNWDSAYTTVSSNSSNNWDNSKSNEYTHTNFLPLTGGTLSSINFQTTGTAPSLDNYIVAWLDVYVENVLYKMPLYQ